LPVSSAAVNSAILLVVRSLEYRNLPLGVIWMSAAQTFGLSSFGAAVVGVRAAPTDACGAPPNEAGVHRHRANAVYEHQRSLARIDCILRDCPESSLSTYK
jgi:hypothetical protein